MIRIVSTLLSVFAGSVLFGVCLPSQDQDQVSRRDFMRTKLLFSQNIVEGLSVKDFELIGRGAQEIINVTEGGQWSALDTPEYLQHSEQLKQAAQRLMAAASEKNLEATALRYFDMTLQCIDCHEYIRTKQF